MEEQAQQPKLRRDEDPDASKHTFSRGVGLWPPSRARWTAAELHAGAIEKAEQSAKWAQAQSNAHSRAKQHGTLLG
jgi:hypothetical protein